MFSACVSGIGAYSGQLRYYTPSDVICERENTRSLLNSARMRVESASLERGLDVTKVLSLFICKDYMFIASGSGIGAYSGQLQYYTSSDVVCVCVRVGERENTRNCWILRD